ncbi:hypothetical protein N657DRAFT_677369 [Parathielavia appendiculata]|uniref:Uncharacterized protein n=1 Tax=Parathielavia appendiculata TaxID=2587402 RepID=A0AAN6Z9G3_9PEZI|nr:hypothetical protein N657DRAFT_677369 [Parathielavia appendiculata]
MRAIRSITNTLPRATALRIFTTGPTTDTPPASHNVLPHGTYQPAISAYTPIDLQSNRGVFSPNRSSHIDATGALNGNNTHSFSTQIYQGQACPSTRRGLHMDHLRTPTTQNPGLGPATGLGTGVNISAQMFGFEIRPNATESEAYVVADRSEVDPLPPELHHTIRLGAGEAAPRPTESEEDVFADRGGWEDPLMEKRPSVPNFPNFSDKIRELVTRIHTRTAGRGGFRFGSQLSVQSWLAILGATFGLLSHGLATTYTHVFDAWSTWRATRCDEDPGFDYASYLNTQPQAPVVALGISTSVGYKFAVVEVRYQATEAMPVDRVRLRLPPLPAVENGTASPWVSGGPTSGTNRAFLHHLDYGSSFSDEDDALLAPRVIVMDSWADCGGMFHPLDSGALVTWEVVLVARD